MSKYNELYVISLGQKHIFDPNLDKVIDFASKFKNKEEALNVAKIMKRAEGKSVDAPVKLIKITVEEVDING